MHDELRHFLLLVEHGSFTAAARRAHLSQPSLSASIRRLEDAMGAALFDRLPRGATPTAAGHALVPHAKAALGAVASGQRAVADVLGLRRGEVSIAAGATACTYVLPQLLTAFRDAHPALTLRLRETFTLRVHDAVRAGHVDLGIAQEPAPDLHNEHWRTDPLVLVASPDRVHQAAEMPLVAFVQGAALRALTDQHFAERDVVMELGSIAAVKGAVRAGMGLALLSTSAVQHDLEVGRLAHVPDARTPLLRTFWLVHHGLDRLSPSAHALRSQLKAAPSEGPAVPAEAAP